MELLIWLVVGALVLLALGVVLVWRERRARKLRAALRDEHHGDEANSAALAAALTSNAGRTF